ncbi:asparaginase [Pelagicoccus sp. SDUM812003]|uniref:asparaginase n=1 Tax=Pelagicoccus sp. SDUM812003 TaxID=3041267 RepID=UPI00280F8821|nr:asparaginase [Pelagicoccus sp. SDUM812003]MDQ8204674.1 asparaginase [Pelagicoccus sp. SDUM812003]
MIQTRLSKTMTLFAIALAIPLAATSLQAKSKVHVLGTGGTISGAAPSPEMLSGYKSGTYPVADLLAEVPEITELADVTSEQIINVGSGRITGEILLKLSKRINQLCQEQPDIDGFVVTHGTGTLEETAYFLNLTVLSDKPVVVVGAMRPWTAISGDGPLNLYNAVRVASAPESRGKGAMIVLNDEINSAREGTKTDTYRVETFNSREYGFLGYADPDKIVFYRKPLKRHTFQTEFDVTKIDELPQVDIVYGYQEASRGSVDGLVAAGVKGIVSASGSPEISDALEDAQAKGVMVVRSDRKGQGRVLNSERRLEQGTISADNLRPQKARLLLQLALTKTSDPVEIQRIFNQY